MDDPTPEFQAGLQELVEKGVLLPADVEDINHMDAETAVRFLAYKEQQYNRGGW